MSENHDAAPSFGMSLLATLGVVAAPAAALAGLNAGGLDLPLWQETSVATAASVITSGAGARIWSRRVGPSGARFGDLMLWTWWRRRRVESRILAEFRRLEPADGELSTDERLAILTWLNGALEYKDSYTRGHSRRVEQHVFRTAVAMHLKARQIEVAKQAAALHDVGKIEVPLDVLHKDGPLTPQETAEVQRHPVVGAELLERVVPSPVVAAVRHHHERWDGRGYPDGLAGDEIPIEARVICVADAYDAMTSTRPYRAGMKPRHAREQLIAGRGSQFDAVVVDEFLRALPTGVTVAAAGALVAIARGTLGDIARTAKRVGFAAMAPAVAAATTISVGGSQAFDFFERPPRIAEVREQEKEGDASRSDAGAAGSKAAPGAAPAPRGKAVGHSSKRKDKGKAVGRGKAKTRGKPPGGSSGKAKPGKPDSKSARDERPKDKGRPDKQPSAKSEKPGSGGEGGSPPGRPKK